MKNYSLVKNFYVILNNLVILNFAKRTNEETSCVRLHPSAKLLGVQNLSPTRFRNKFKKTSLEKNAAFTLAEGAMHVEMSIRQCKAAFTLAEVLITLAIIGIVAAMTIPTLISKYQDNQFKTAYKKAYSDLNQVLMSSLAYNEMPNRTKNFDVDATKAEFELIKSGLKVSKQCDRDNFYECWAKGDTLCGGACFGDAEGGIDMENGQPVPIALGAFLDISGRSWTPYSGNENVYLVDTNGLAGPNLFGKDRWMFTFADQNGNRVASGHPIKVIPNVNRDVLSIDAFCKHPPCYYYTWLYER